MFTWKCAHPPLLPCPTNTVVQRIPPARPNFCHLNVHWTQRDGYLLCWVLQRHTSDLPPKALHIIHNGNAYPPPRYWQPVIGGWPPPLHPTRLNRNSGEGQATPTPAAGLGLDVPTWKADRNVPQCEPGLEADCVILCLSFMKVPRLVPSIESRD